MHKYGNHWKELQTRVSFECSQKAKPLIRRLRKQVTLLIAVLEPLDYPSDVRYCKRFWSITVIWLLEPRHISTQHLQMLNPCRSVHHSPDAQRLNWKSFWNWNLVQLDLQWCESCSCWMLWDCCNCFDYHNYSKHRGACMHPLHPISGGWGRIQHFCDNFCLDTSR